MRIGVNLLWCVPGVGGSEEYLVRQLLGLVDNTHDYVVDVFAPKGFSLRQPRLASHFNIVEAPSTCTRRAIRIVLEHTWLTWRTRRHNVVHHGGGTMPRWGNSTTVLTVHDVQWTRYPEYVAPVKLKYLQRVVPLSLKRATCIVVPTHFVASTLMENFGVSSEKISVVRHGVESDVLTQRTEESVLRARWNVGSGPVWAFPAITHPHKNHLFVLELMAATTGPWADPTAHLVCAGSAGSSDAVVKQFVAEHGLENRVVMPGRISEPDRNGLLAMSEAMVFPSQYEGFGAPLIEAMHLGTAILASNCASIPEVVGDAGVVVPLDRDAWIEGLHLLRSHRDDLIRRGQQRAAYFTTALSGADLLVAYRTALGEQQ
jgi:glycosyltransferase involved in cell wall biosynthesis